MATRFTAAVPEIHDTDANFRARVTEFIAAVTAMGWVQTADTAQINPATVTRPTTANASQGYAMFRMADALQAAAPVFMRVGFGSNDVAGNPNFTIQFGQGSNGAGTLTGLLSDAFDVGSRNTSLGLGWFTSGSTNRLSMAIWADSSAPHTTIFSVERTKDAAGADTPDGLIIMSKSARMWASGAGVFADDLCTYQAFMFYAGAVLGSTAPRSFHNGTPCFAHGNGPSGSNPVGPDTPVFPWKIPSGRGSENDPVNLLSYKAAEIPGFGTEFDASMYGSNRHYKGFTTVAATLFWGGSGTPFALTLQTGALAMRWE